MSSVLKKLLVSIWQKSNNNRSAIFLALVSILIGLLAKSVLYFYMHDPTPWTKSAALWGNWVYLISISRPRGKPTPISPNMNAKREMTVYGVCKADFWPYLRQKKSYQADAQFPPPKNDIALRQKNPNPLQKWIFFFGGRAEAKSTFLVPGSCCS